MKHYLYVLVFISLVSKPINASQENEERETPTTSPLKMALKESWGPKTVYCQNLEDLEKHIQSFQQTIRQSSKGDIPSLPTKDLQASLHVQSPETLCKSTGKRIHIPGLGLTKEFVILNPIPSQEALYLHGYHKGYFKQHPYERGWQIAQSLKWKPIQTFSDYELKIHAKIYNLDILERGKEFFEKNFRYFTLVNNYWTFITHPKKIVPKNPSTQPYYVRIILRKVFETVKDII
jgi:hypothetical protein